jgi:Protein of unknown function, DUF488
MLGALSTIGYVTKGAASQLEDVLIANKKAVIVDTRLKPWCHWSTSWQRPTLETRYQKQYFWKGDVLGNSNHAFPTRPIQIVDERRGLPWIIQTLEEGTTIILLCGCASYETCHRKVIYDKVKALLGERLPTYTLGQRVMTPNGPGIIDPSIPLDVQIQRNKYAVHLEMWHPSRYYAPDQLAPYHPEQVSLFV